MPTNFSNKYPHLQVIDVNLFYRAKGSKTFIAEVSEKGLRLGVQVYLDACDEGFIVKNPKTENEVLLTNSGVTFGTDGREVSAYKYTAWDKRNIKGLDAYEFVVLND